MRQGQPGPVWADPPDLDLASWDTEQAWHGLQLSLLCAIQAGSSAVLLMGMMPCPQVTEGHLDPRDPMGPELARGVVGNRDMGTQQYPTFKD